MYLLSFTLLLALTGHAASQSLVVVGGGLSDGNAAIWSKVVELAVRVMVLKFRQNSKIKIVVIHREAQASQKSVFFVPHLQIRKDQQHIILTCL